MIINVQRLLVPLTSVSLLMGYKIDWKIAILFAHKLNTHSFPTSRALSEGRVTYEVLDLVVLLHVFVI